MTIDETAERFGMHQFPGESRFMFEKRVNQLLDQRKEKEKNDKVAQWRKPFKKDQEWT